MSSTVLSMSMSLDGFIAGPNEAPDNGLGDGGIRLHDWVFPDLEGDEFDEAVGRLRGVNRQVYDEMMATGAVIAGRGTFEPAGGWGGDHHDGIPIYVLSRGPAPGWAAEWPAVHYVSDLEVAVREAKRAAGDKDVLVHGAGITERPLPPAFSTSSPSISCRCCSVRVASCSNTSAWSSASWSGSGFSRARAAWSTSATAFAAERTFSLTATGSMPAGSRGLLRARQAVGRCAAHPCRRPRSGTTIQQTGRTSR